MKEDQYKKRVAIIHRLEEDLEEIHCNKSRSKGDLGCQQRNNQLCNAKTQVYFGILICKGRNKHTEHVGVF